MDPAWTLGRVGTDWTRAGVGGMGQRDLDRGWALKAFAYRKGHFWTLTLLLACAGCNLDNLTNKAYS